MTRMKAKSPETVTKLRQAAWKKFGDDHPVKKILFDFDVLKLLLLGQGLA